MGSIIARIFAVLVIGAGAVGGGSALFGENPDSTTDSEPQIDQQSDIEKTVEILEEKVLEESKKGLEESLGSDETKKRINTLVKEAIRDTLSDLVSSEKEVAATSTATSTIETATSSRNKTDE